jgi:hypothetical protein
MPIGGCALLLRNLANIVESSVDIRIVLVGLDHWFLRYFGHCER